MILPENQNSNTQAPLNDIAAARRTGLNVEQVLSLVGEVSALPEVALSVINIVDQPDTTAHDLQVIIEQDPSLAARVLRCVNSSLYGLRSKVNNLGRAISLLGLQQVRNLAITSSVAHLFQDSNKIGQYQRTNLWRHMVTVGVAARMIALRSNLRNFEEIFLAGLVHDIGIMIEDQFCHEAFIKVIHELNEKDTLSEIETRIMGFDHSEIGWRLAQSWNFPQDICDAIHYHHKLEFYKGAHGPSVACVSIGNMLATLRGYSSVGSNHLRPDTEALNQLGASQRDLRIWMEDLSEELEKNKELMQT